MAKSKRDIIERLEKSANNSLKVRRAAHAISKELGLGEPSVERPSVSDILNTPNLSGDSKG